MDDQTKAFMEQANAIHAERESKRADEQRIRDQKQREGRSALLEVFRFKLLELGLDVIPESEKVQIGDIRLELHYPGFNATDADEIRRKSFDACIRVYIGKNISSFHYAKSIEDFVTALENAGYFKNHPTLNEPETGDPLEYIAIKDAYPSQHDPDAPIFDL